MPLAEWERRLAGLDICFAPVATLDEVAADPQVVHRDMLPTMETTLGPIACRVCRSSSPIPRGLWRTPPPTLGADTDSVLRSIGFQAAAIVRLRADGVV